MEALCNLILRAARLAWWPAAIAIFLVGGFGIVGYRNLQQLAVSTPPTSGGSFLERWNRAFHFAASTRNSALLVRPNSGDNMQILLVDFTSGKRTRLKSERAHLMSPYLSPDGTRLLFSRQHLDRQDHELVSCDTGTLNCRQVLTSPGSIHSAIQIYGGRILYVSSPYVKGLDGRIRLSRNDIWIFDPATGPRQLTNFRLYQLHSLSVSNNHLYFSALGPSRDTPVIPKYEPNANQQSDIFRLPFDPETGTIDIPHEMMEPLFLSAGIATHPSASADGSLVGFLRTRTGINPYHYDLVIADLDSRNERLNEASGIGSSRPVIIEHDVYTSVTKDDRVLIRVSRPGAATELIAEIDDASIANADTVELKIEP